MTVQHKAKVLLLGDGAVGKTSLIRRYVEDQYQDGYIATIGAKVTKKDVTIQEELFETTATLMIWDVLGQHEYTRVQEGAFAGARGALLVYDVNRTETFDNLKKFWIRRLWSVVGKVPVAVLGNKVDLLQDRSEEITRLHHLAESLECTGWLTSAKTGENVELAFLALTGAILKSEITEDVKRVKVQLGEGVDPYSAAAMADKIMMDFCNIAGGVGPGMPVVRQVFAQSGMDIRRPTKKALLKVIDALAVVEQGLQMKDDIAACKQRRLAWVNEIRE